LNELGVFAGEERLQELCGLVARRVAILDGHGLLGHCSCFTGMNRGLD
jgi:hypothetical protein